jgi:hypothetical protein
MLGDATLSAELGPNLSGKREMSGVELALSPTFDPAFYGELVQFGKVLPWESGIPVAHTAAA